MIGLGAALGLAWAALKSPEARALRNFDAGLWALSGGLLGGRLAHTAAAWPYYGNHLLEIPQVWLGGLSGPGAAAGFVFALGFYAALSGLSLGSLADALLPLALAVVISAWLACWLDGSAYGAPAASFGGFPARDEWGQWRLRWPVQLLGAMLTMLIFWLLDRDTLAALSGRRSQRALSRLAARLQNAAPGTLSRLAFFLLCVEFLLLSFLRADPVPLFRGLRLDTWAYAALTGLSAIPLLFFPIFRLYTDKGIGDKG